MILRTSESPSAPPSSARRGSKSFTSDASVSISALGMYGGFAVTKSHAPRSRSIYSDLGFILLGFLAADRGGATLNDQFAALLAGQADYMIIGLYPGREEARKLGLFDAIEFLPKELVSAAMYVAFSKQSKCGALRTGFSDGIRTAVDGGAPRQLPEAVDKSLGQ